MLQVCRQQRRLPRPDRLSRLSALMQTTRELSLCRFYQKWRAFSRMAPLRPVHRRHLLGLTAVKCALILLSMLPPWGVRYLIDVAVPNGDWGQFWRMSLGIAGALGTSLVLTLFSDYIATRLTALVSMEFKASLWRQLDHAPLSEFARFGTGDRLYRFTADLDNVRNLVTNILPQFALNMLQCTVVAVFSLQLNAQMTAVFLCSVPVFVTLEALHAKRLRPIQTALMKRVSQIQNSMTEYFDGAQTIRLYRMERFLRRRFGRHLTAQVRQILQRWRTDRTYATGGWILNTGWNWLVLIFGIGLVMKEQLSLGTLIALRLYLGLLSRPLEGLVDMTQGVVLASVSLERVLAATNLGVPARLGAPRLQLRRSANRAPAHLGVEELAFAYDSSRPVLSGFNLICEPGILLGLTGPSGGGKSTAVSLIARLLTPQMGRILLDGLDISLLSDTDLRRHLSVVPQETFLFRGTVAENIGFGDRMADAAEIRQAARRAGADEFISQLPGGYQTVVGETGHGMSGGQKQRIALARAFLSKSRLLVLDEALNSLERSTCQHILGSLRELAAHKTIILIGHSLEILRACDRVAVLAGGRVTQSGPPEKLTEAGVLSFLSPHRSFAPDSPLTL